MSLFVSQLVMKLKRLPFINITLLFGALSLLFHLPYDPKIYLKGDWILLVADYPWLVFILICIAAPLLATLLFQVLPYRLFGRDKGLKAPYVVAISSVLFAAVTYVGIGLLANTLLIGATLSCFYLLLYSESSKRAFWATAFIYFVRSVVVLMSVCFGQNI